jgi:alanyl-tRNA synthetase
MVLEEELAFASTLGRGIKYFDQLSSKIIVEAEQVGAAVTAQEVPGDAAFFLYDSLGFPLDLTQLMAEERGLVVDTVAFDKCMAEQQQRSRAGRSAGSGSGGSSGALAGVRAAGAASEGVAVEVLLGTEDVEMLRQAGIVPTLDSLKYNHGDGDEQEHAAKVVAVLELVQVDGRHECRVRTAGRAALSCRKAYQAAGGAEEDGVTVGLVLDATPFYAEAGGQVPDTGSIRSTISVDTGTATISVKAVAAVMDVQSFGGFVLHTVGASIPPSVARSPSLFFEVGDEVQCAVDSEHRQLVAPNHSATHLLAHALRQVLGNGVEQRGSHNNADRLRFDFSHGSAMTENELALVQQIVREEVEQHPSPVYAAEVPLAQALAVNGIGTIPGESYPDPVRMVVMGSGQWRVRPNDTPDAYTSFPPSTTPSSVAELLASPEHAEWPLFSVELCGGTHVGHTGELEAFSIIEQEAVGVYQ